MLKGLTEKEVLVLRKKYGGNLLPLKEGPSWFLILLSQFKSPLIYILLLTAIISLFLSEYTDVILIAAVIILNVIMGFYQEYNAERTLLTLSKIIKPKAKVIREGKRKRIDTKDLVPGDIVLLNSGDKIPADGLLIEGVKLLVNEAILTGEEEAVEKRTQDKLNLVYMGTNVLSGRGVIKVLKTGRETEIGKIGQSLSQIKEEATPLQQRINKFAKSLAIIVGVICFFIFLIGWLTQGNTLSALRIAIILVIAAIPEGLPIVVTIVLAIGMQRILKRKGLVKKLMAIETLGSTSVICTDKTGTLTEGKMQVVKTNFTDKEKALSALILANDQGNNLEISLWDYVKAEGMDPERTFYSKKRIYEETFDSEKKFMLSVNQLDGKDTAFIVGAPEIILEFCKISKEEKNAILNKIEHWADEGLRVLGVIYKNEGILKVKKDFQWLGLVGIRDPIRKSVKETIKETLQGGIKVKIVTGDYRKTAEKVATSLGFDISPKSVLEGAELEKITYEELKKRIDDIVLFARITPHQKLKIIKALQEKGEIVAMTGDGVNDAPALKKANIGVVVESGSDVAKEVGDLILLDSNFKTIIAACEEGRIIFSNIRKVVGYILSNSFAEIILIFGAMLLKLGAPLTVVQILWIHLICDGPPDIVLGFERQKRELREDKPRVIQKERILSGPIKFLILAISATVGLLSLVFFWYFEEMKGDLNLARTIAFTTIATVSLVYIFSFRNLRKSILQTKDFFQNKYLFLGVLYGFVLIFVAVYLPGLNKILGTVPLKPIYWVIALGVAIIATVWVEIVKLISNTNKKSLKKH